MEIARARMHTHVCAHDDLSPDTKLISKSVNDGKYYARDSK